MNSSDEYAPTRMSTLFLLRFGAELHELSSNTELARLVQWTQTFQDQLDSEPPSDRREGLLWFAEHDVSPTYKGTLALPAHEAIEIELTWPHDYPFRPPNVKIGSSGEPLDVEILDQWSPALMTHHWLLMILTGGAGTFSCSA
jgi:hypothetical protein